MVQIRVASDNSTPIKDNSIKLTNFQVQYSLFPLEYPSCLY